MKYTIEAIENAKVGMKWDEIGCHWTLGQAYLYSKEAGNDLPNFAEVIWDDDIETILSDCRQLGVKEFTISSTFSSLIETIAKFEELGCTLDGIVKSGNATPTLEAKRRARAHPGLQDDGKGGIRTCGAKELSASLIQ